MTGVGPILGLEAGRVKETGGFEASLECNSEQWGGPGSYVCAGGGARLLVNTFGFRLQPVKDSR